MRFGVLWQFDVKCFCSFFGSFRHLSPSLFVAIRIVEGPFTDIDFHFNLSKCICLLRLPMHVIFLLATDFPNTQMTSGAENCADLPLSRCKIQINGVIVNIRSTSLHWGFCLAATPPSSPPPLPSSVVQKDNEPSSNAIYASSGINSFSIYCLSRIRLFSSIFPDLSLLPPL